jgi:thiol-disulfide isomerase/thioredoxin
MPRPLASELALQDACAGGDGRLVVVYFTASGSPPCNRIDPHVHALCKEFPFADFFTVDADLTPHLLEQREIHELPTFYFCRYGERLGVYTGADSRGLHALLVQYGGSPPELRKLGDSESRKLNVQLSQQLQQRHKHQQLLLRRQLFQELSSDAPHRRAPHQHRLTSKAHMPMVDLQTVRAARHGAAHALSCHSGTPPLARL